MTSDRHGPNRLDRYQQIHETVMGQFRDRGFVVSDSLAFQDLDDDLIILEGQIDCLGGIAVEVTKHLKVLSEAGAKSLVQTNSYSYHAKLVHPETGKAVASQVPPTCLDRD